MGYQAVDSSGSKEKPNVVLDQLIKVTPTGVLAIPGLYMPADPGAPDAQSKEGHTDIFWKVVREGVAYSSRLGSLLRSSKRASP